jgi:hypothetical protein
VTGSPLLTSYTTYFVSSVTGSDSNSGLDPNFPMATLGVALLAAAGAVVTPIVVLLSGHDQTLTAGITPVAGTIIVGAGSSGGKPTAKLTMNLSNTTMLTLSAAGVQLRNVWIKPNLISNNVARIKVTGAGCYIKGCYFECGSSLDAAAALEVGTGGNNSVISGNTFISTAAVTTSKPTYGFLVSAAVSDMFLLNNTVSEGTVGFGTLAVSFGATVTRLTCEPITPLLGANMTFGSSTGFVMPSGATGASTISYAGGA